MGNIFNDDFQDFLKDLNIANVQYLIVGGYSVILYSYARTTGDLDIWVNPTKENYHKLNHAFNLFGMPMFDLSESKFLNTKDFDAFSFGRPPVSIDILTAVKGLEFEDCFPKAKIFIENEIEIRSINLNHLLTYKKAAGRNRDLNDIEQLSKVKKTN